MRLRSTGIHVTRAGLLFVSVSLAYAQVHSGQANSASHVGAEMTKGKLNPSESKPGDTVAIKLKDDVRSNGQVILKKGTTITGVVRNVKRAEAIGEWKGQAQSIMEIEWLIPAVEARTVKSLSFALQSVIQINPVYEDEQNNSSDEFATSPVRETVSSTAASGRSNVALLSMPSVVALDQQTSSNIESALGTSSAEPLFRVGHGQLLSAGGSKQSVDLYSHLSNDTVITSPNKNFEISSGAQMQMLVGVNGK